MKSTYRLKKPILLTFARDGITREEALLYVTFERLGEGERPEPGGYQNVEDMIRRLDLEDEEMVSEARELLAYCDIDFALREAYLTAEYRARDYIWAAVNRDQAEPCPVNVPTREERRAAAFAKVDEYLKCHPDEAERLEKAAEFIRDHPDEAVREQEPEYGEGDQ